MTKLTRIEVNCSTGEQNELELTAAEIAEAEQRATFFAEEEARKQAEEQVKADAKLSAQAKLQALGLTGEEISAITE